MPCDPFAPPTATAVLEINLAISVLLSLVTVGLLLLVN